VKRRSGAPSAFTAGQRAPSFLVPEEVRENFRNGIGKRSAQMSSAWKQMLARYEQVHPDLFDALQRMQRRELPAEWDKDLPVFAADPKGVSGRDASEKVLNAVAKNVPWLLGGSADLTPSTKTRLAGEGMGDFEAGHYDGRNFHFGIREHTMAAVLNGMSLSKLRPYGSGFLIFSDYSRPAIRLSALMEIPVIYIFTHDSIGVGEDGPTHQPVEQLASLRAIPNLVAFRPADANGSWNRGGPPQGNSLQRPRLLSRSFSSRTRWMRHFSSPPDRCVISPWG
jgi:transketolase